MFLELSVSFTFFMAFLDFFLLLLLFQLRTDLCQQKVCIVNKPRLNISQIPGGLNLQKTEYFTNISPFSRVIKCPLIIKVSCFTLTMSIKCIAYLTFNYKLCPFFLDVIVLQRVKFLGVRPRTFNHSENR